MNLEFDPAEHRYTLDGKRVPAVSDILEPLQMLEGIPLAVLEPKRILGQHVHAACAMMLQKVLDWRALDTKIVPYVTAAKRFVEECEVKVLSVEYRMADPVLKFAGTLDLYGLMNQRAGVFDWKIPDVMPRTAGPQTAAYDHLFRRTLGGRPLKRYGVQLKDDGTYKLFEFNDSRDWVWFQSALNLWYWRNAA